MRIFHSKVESSAETTSGELEEQLLIVRSVSLFIIAAIAVIFALDQAAIFFITLLLGIFLAYTLNPIVVWLHYIHIPRVLGSSITVISLVALVTLGAVGLKGQVDDIIAQLPNVSKKFSTLMVTKKNSPLTN
ncbi:MAG TPA: AI-2E family transporter, partial [Methylophilus sp.]